MLAYVSWKHNSCEGAFLVVVLWETEAEDLPQYFRGKRRTGEEKSLASGNGCKGTTLPSPPRTLIPSLSNPIIAFYTWYLVNIYG
jgi:hypothetical protein